MGAGGTLIAFFGTADGNFVSCCPQEHSSRPGGDIRLRKSRSLFYHGFLRYGDGNSKIGIHP